MYNFIGHNFGGIIVFKFSVIIDSFQKTFSNFCDFSELCERNYCIDTEREQSEYTDLRLDKRD